MIDYATRYNKDELERMWFDEHLTLEQIGERLGITRQAAHNRLRRCRIDTASGSKFKVKCSMCGTPFEITRTRWKKSLRHFHSHKCHAEWLRSPEAEIEKTSQRMAKNAIWTNRSVEVKPGEVVAFLDGNVLNLRDENLKIFASREEYVEFLRKR